MASRWYIVHAHSGFEQKVAHAIIEQAEKKNMKEKFEEVFVPTQHVVEVKKGRKVNADKKFFPGYVMVKMEMNDDTWHLVKSTPKVTGFLGSANKPQPISEVEAKRIFDQVKDGVDSPQKSVRYEAGESVKIVDGPFESFVGTVEEVDEDKNKLKISVSIFGRPTPVELDFMQVERT